MTFGITLETFLALIVLTMACYRVALMISEDFGPFGVFFLLRERVKVEWMRAGIECIGCVGVWVSFVAIVILRMLGLVEPHNAFGFWLAVSGGICFINRIAPCR